MNGTDASSVSIEFRGVDFSYGNLPVLKGIDLSIEASSTVCIVGPNGGGKSTLLKLIMGLLEPDRGKVRVLGASPRQARTRIGYMPQTIDFDPLFPIVVEQIIRMGCLRGRGVQFFRAEDRERTFKVLKEMDLEAVARKSFGDLSGGLKQRVLIARALVAEPQILLLDEPTAMVDAHIEARLLEHLKELHSTMTIVLVSHDTHFVHALVDEVVCVNREVAIHPLSKERDMRAEALYGESVRAVDHSTCLEREHGRE